MFSTIAAAIMLFALVIFTAMIFDPRVVPPRPIWRPSWRLGAAGLVALLAAMSAGAPQGPAAATGPYPAPPPALPPGPPVPWWWDGLGIVGALVALALATGLAVLVWRVACLVAEWLCWPLTGVDVDIQEAHQEAEA